jgi:tRNA (mo5U34)-methyltransferase
MRRVMRTSQMPRRRLEVVDHTGVPDATLRAWVGPGGLPRHLPYDAGHVIRFGRRKDPAVLKRVSVEGALQTEIEQPPPWMYAWQLSADTVTPVVGPELPEIHQTRLDLMEAPVRAAIAAAGGGATVVDLACNEGWFSHRMLEWGASHVLGVDIRPEVIRRAELIRAHFGISPDRFELRLADVFDLEPEQLGAFDVVLCLGVVYHLENPIGAIRVARALARGVCVIESQLTRQLEAIVHGNGRSDQYEESPSSWASVVETDQASNMLASAGGVVSLIPNRDALMQAAHAAGFGSAEYAQPSRRHNRQYQLGDRAVLIAWPGAPPGEGMTTMTPVTAAIHTAP